MQFSMTRLILYVYDVDLLRYFYQKHFELGVTENIPGEWAVLTAGAMEIALHRVGVRYRESERSASHSNTKMVFHVPAGLEALRAKLNADGVPMRELKRFDGFPWLMCDGCDPEGNVFQLCQPD
jgi:predicted enzyme related to lactoylglutathione lyase